MLFLFLVHFLGGIKDVATLVIAETANPSMLSANAYKDLEKLPHTKLTHCPSKPPNVWQQANLGQQEKCA